MNDEGNIRNAILSIYEDLGKVYLNFYYFELHIFLSE